MHRRRPRTKPGRGRSDLTMPEHHRPLRRTRPRLSPLETTSRHRPRDRLNPCLTKPTHKRLTPIPLLWRCRMRHCTSGCRTWGSCSPPTRSGISKTVLSCDALLESGDRLVACDIDVDIDAYGDTIDDDRVWLLDRRDVVDLAGEHVDYYRTVVRSHRCSSCGGLHFSEARRVAGWACSWSGGGVAVRVGGGLLVAVLMVGLVVPAGVAAHSGGSGGAGFSDLGDGVHAPAVRALAAEGVFEGTECGQGLFCPEEPVRRSTMAVWLVRVLDGVDPVGSGSRFSDVDPDAWWAPYVERLAVLGVTLGCATEPARYCPSDSVTRGQMATFLTRAFALEPAPPFGFVDIEGNTHTVSIDALAAAGVTLGCATGPARYCPSDSVTRGQMATFLTRAIERGQPGAGSGPGLDEGADVLEGLDDGDDRIPVVGDWVIPVFVCAPAGVYTAADLEDWTAVLNQELDGFFERLSSRRMTLRFTVGSVLSDDIAWASTTLSRLLIDGRFPCNKEALRRSGTTQVLILADLEGGGIGGYARLRSGPAVAPTPAKSGDRVPLVTVVHELAHSVLGLRHLKNAANGAVFVNRPSTLANRSALLAQPALACYQYEQLDWPVPDYVEPCVRLSPSPPESITSGLNDSGLAVLTWEPPSFSDDTPVTGYTVRWYRGTGFVSGDEPYAEYETPADPTSHLIDASTEPGTYIVEVLAHSRYGQGDSGTSLINYVPVPPSLAPIRATNITQDSIQLVWNPQTQQEFLEETKIRVTYQIQYKATGDTGYEETRGYFEGTAWLGYLEEGTEYTIRMRACSDMSAEICTSWQTIEASTFTDSVLPPPSPISASSGSDWYLLTWDRVPGSAGYLIELSDGGRQIRTYAPDYSAAFGIQPNTTYSVKVGSCNPGALNCEPEEWTVVSVATTSAQAVPHPYRIGLREIADSWASVQWEVFRNGRWLYNVEYEYTDGITSSGVLTHQKRTEEPLRLTVEPNKTYSLKMRNCESRGSGSGSSCSVWTSFAFSTSPATSPVPPPSVRATDIADIWLGISWDRVPGAVSYDWRFKEATAGSPWRWGSETEPTLETGWRLEPNTTYTAEVRSCGDPTKPCSNWTSTTVSTTRSLAPAPQSYPVSVASVTDTEIHLAWNPPNSHRYYYTARLFPTEEEHLIFVHNLQAQSQDWVLSHLEPNTAYTLAVRVCQWPLDSNCDNWVAINVTTRPS